MPPNVQFHDPVQVAPSHVPIFLVVVKNSFASMGNGNLWCPLSIFEDTAEITHIGYKFSFINP